MNGYPGALDNICLPNLAISHHSSKGPLIENNLFFLLQVEGRCDNYNNDIRHNDTQRKGALHNDNPHNDNTHNETRYKRQLMALSITTFLIMELV